MELTIADVSDLAHADPQLVRRAIRDGFLQPLRRIGPTVVIDDLAATSWIRSIATGRRWAPEVREAAFDLASSGHTDRLSSSERSRLRARLRHITAAEFAHAAGGLGGTWARYRTTAGDVGDPIGPNVIDLAGLGIVPGHSGIRFAATESLDALELRNDLTLDSYGNLGVVEREADPRLARALLDTYLLGTDRESRAAAIALEGRCRDV